MRKPSCWERALLRRSLQRGLSKRALQKFSSYKLLLKFAARSFGQAVCHGAFSYGGALLSTN
ncbi:MAG TPA: hypothetical protein DCS07_18000 [Bdellovibrionales bacterium]|nr:hypothetical protein [Bdellovibrionales bacterium]HCM38571.1 hypothetical protein [Bdellovibrionales bacterium]